MLDILQHNLGGVRQAKDFEFNFGGERVMLGILPHNLCGFLVGQLKDFEFSFIAEPVVFGIFQQNLYGFLVGQRKDFELNFFVNYCTFSDQVQDDFAGVGLSKHFFGDFLFHNSVFLIV